MKEEKVKLFPRRLARAAARAKLDQDGVTGYNKERIRFDGDKLPSMFSIHWRELAAQAVRPPDVQKLKKAAQIGIDLQREMAKYDQAKARKE